MVVVEPHLGTGVRLNADGSMALFTTKWSFDPRLGHIVLSDPLAVMAASNLAGGSGGYAAHDPAALQDNGLYTYDPGYKVYKLFSMDLKSPTKPVPITLNVYLYIIREKLPSGVPNLAAQQEPPNAWPSMPMDSSGSARRLLGWARGPLLLVVEAVALCDGRLHFGMLPVMHVFSGVDVARIMSAVSEHDRGPLVDLIADDVFDKQDHEVHAGLRYHFALEHLNSWCVAIPADAAQQPHATPANNTWNAAARNPNVQNPTGNARPPTPDHLQRGRALIDAGQVQSQMHTPPPQQQQQQQQQEEEEEKEDVSACPGTADSNGSIVGHKRARGPAPTSAAAKRAVGSQQGAAPWGSAYAGVQQQLPGNQAPGQRPLGMPRQAQYQSAPMVAGQGQGNIQVPGSIQHMPGNAQLPGSSQQMPGRPMQAAMPGQLPGQQVPGQQGGPSAAFPTASAAMHDRAVPPSAQGGTPPHAPAFSGLAPAAAGPGAGGAGGVPGAFGGSAAGGVGPTADGLGSGPGGACMPQATCAQGNVQGSGGVPGVVYMPQATRAQGSVQGPGGMQPGQGGAAFPRPHLAMQAPGGMPTQAGNMQQPGNMHQPGLTQQQQQQQQPQQQPQQEHPWHVQQGQEQQVEQMQQPGQQGQRPSPHMQAGHALQQGGMQPPPGMLQQGPGIMLSSLQPPFRQPMQPAPPGQQPFQHSMQQPMQQPPQQPPQQPMHAAAQQPMQHPGPAHTGQMGPAQMPPAPQFQPLQQQQQHQQQQQQAPYGMPWASGPPPGFQGPQHLMGPLMPGFGQPPMRPPAWQPGPGRY